MSVVAVQLAPWHSSELQEPGGTEATGDPDDRRAIVSPFGAWKGCPVGVVVVAAGGLVEVVDGTVATVVEDWGAVVPTGAEVVVMPVPVVAGPGAVVVVAAGAVVGPPPEPGVVVEAGATMGGGGATVVEAAGAVVEEDGPPGRVPPVPVVTSMAFASVSDNVMPWLSTVRL